jgi:hypothetical protein
MSTSPLAGLMPVWNPTAGSAVGAHQQEAPDAGTLCRVRRGFCPTVLQRLESNALARKLAQDADVVDDRVAALYDRVDRVG